MSGKSCTTKRYSLLPSRDLILNYDSGIERFRLWSQFWLFSVVMWLLVGSILCWYVSPIDWWFRVLSMRLSFVLLQSASPKSLGVQKVVYTIL